MDRINSGIAYSPEFVKPLNGSYIATTVGLGFIVYLLLWGMLFTSIGMLATKGNKPLYGSLLGVSMICIIAFHVWGYRHNKKLSITTFSTANSSLPSIPVPDRTITLHTPPELRRHDSMTTHTSEHDRYEKEKYLETMNHEPERYDMFYRNGYIFYTVTGPDGKPRKMFERATPQSLWARTKDKIKNYHKKKR